jgi:hypothetical protein
MAYPHPRWLRRIGLSRPCLPLLALLVAVLGAGGCGTAPDIGGGNWFVGDTSLKGDAAMFGAGGRTAVMWQFTHGGMVWIWRVSAAGKTREWVVEQRYENASDDPAQGQVWWMGDSTGSWSGTISPTSPRDSWGKPQMPPFNGSLPGVPAGTGGCSFTIAGVPANGDGHIEGHGQTRSEELFLTLKWIKADGSVGALYELRGLGQNEEEYLDALEKLGVPPPPVVRSVR